MKVKEVMSRQIKSFSPETNAKEALDKLLAIEISGLPVIDEQGKLVGMFTEKDILKHILPTYLEQVGRFVYANTPKGIKSKIADLTHVKIKDIMRKEVVTVDEDTSISEVAHIMLTQKVRRIPVLNKEGKVVGVAARQDIIKGLIE